MWFPEYDDVVLFHQRVIEEDPVDRKHPNFRRGGEESLRWILAGCRPTTDSETEMFAAAACLAHGINMAHPFDAANKRTSLIAAGTILDRCGWNLKPDPIDAKDFLQSARESTLPVDAFEEWLRRWSRKE